MKHLDYTWNGWILKFVILHYRAVNLLLRLSLEDYSLFLIEKKVTVSFEDLLPEFRNQILSTLFKACDVTVL